MQKFRSFKEINRHQHDLASFHSCFAAVHYSHFATVYYPHFAAVVIIYALNYRHTVKYSFETDKTNLFYLPSTNHPT